MSRHTRSVFISYRRRDAAAAAGRLYDRVVEVIPRDRVFMDVDAINPGADFRRAIRAEIGRCDLVLAVIGRDWIGARPGYSARISDAADVVRMEIRAALESRARLVPVLVDGASMPAAEGLPEDIQALSQRNAVELRHEHFNADAVALIDRMILRRATHRRKRQRWRRFAFAAGGALLGILLYGLVALAHWFLRGAALSETIGPLATTLLFPISAILGLLVVWCRGQ